MSTDITNYDNIIDSRDVIERIEELQDIENLDEDEQEELVALNALQQEAESYSQEWSHGATLIRDSYFITYAQGFAEDIGAIDREASWPCYCIDWEKAAEDLKQDYAAVDFDGERYWVR
jgi:hypothetical protein